MRIIVVSDRRLSVLALMAALRRIPDAQIVAQVEGLAEARTYCQAGEADVIVSDAAIMLSDTSDRPGALGNLTARGVAELAGAHHRASGIPHVNAMPWQVAPSSVADLSIREREVFVLLGLGLSNRHAARILGVTERTIKTHVGRVLAKLNLESRLQAGLAALLYSAQQGSNARPDRAGRPRATGLPAARAAGVHSLGPGQESGQANDGVIRSIP